MGNQCLPTRCVPSKKQKTQINFPELKMSINSARDFEFFEKSYQRPTNPEYIHLYFVRWLVEKWLFHLLKDQFPLQHSHLRGVWFDQVKGVKREDPKKYRENYMKQQGFLKFCSELRKTTAQMVKEKPKKCLKLELLSFAITEKVRFSEPGNREEGFVCIEEKIEQQQEDSVISLK